MAKYNIPNFGGGLNQAVDPSLISPNEASELMNADITNGTLKPSRDLAPYLTTCPVKIERLMVYHENGTHNIVVSGEGGLYLYDGVTWITIGYGFQNNEWDFLNYKYNNVDVMILVNGIDDNQILTGTTLRAMKDRRITYAADGTVSGYIDAEGVLKATEALVTTLAPKARFVELHYERIWLAYGDSVYFSKDFDPEDYTIPTDEVEANLHGGEVKIETFDGTDIIGLKVVYDDVVIFKEKSLFKITGAYAEQYSKQQLFQSEGAIADGSITVTTRGCFFLGYDGIYLYDGTNVVPISEKLARTIETFNAELLYKSKGATHKSKYYLCVPVEGKWIVLEYNYIDGTFSKHDIAVTGLLTIIDKLYAVTGNKTVYEFGKGNYLPLFYETGYSDLGAPEAIKENEDVYFTAKGDYLVLTLKTEKKEKAKVIPLDSEYKVVKKSLINYGRLLQFRFESTPNGYLEIKNFKAVMDIDED